MFNNRIIMLLSIFSLNGFFGFGQQDKDSTITIENLMKVDSALIILDVRNPAELIGPLGKIYNVINIPLQVLEQRLGELEKFKDKEIAVICRSGNRSNTAMRILQANGFKAKNVLGGMIEYRRKEKTN